MVNAATVENASGSGSRSSSTSNSESVGSKAEVAQVSLVCAALLQISPQVSDAVGCAAPNEPVATATGEGENGSGVTHQNAQRAARSTVAISATSAPTSAQGSGQQGTSVIAAPASTPSSGASNSGEPGVQHGTNQATAGAAVQAASVAGQPAPRPAATRESRSDDDPDCQSLLPSWLQVDVSPQCADARERSGKARDRGRSDRRPPNSH